MSNSAPIARDSKHGTLQRSLVLSAPIFLAPFPAPPARAEGEVRLTIKVVDEAGKPVPDLAVSMVATGEDEYPTRTVTTNRKGSATIPNLSPSSYRPSLESDTCRIVAIAYTARMSDDRQELLADRSIDFTVIGGEVLGGFVEAAE